MRSKLKFSPRLILVLVAMFVLGSVTAATAASVINGKNIKKGTIPFKALSTDAKKQLAKSSKAGPQGPQGAQGPAGAAAARSWAYVTDSGAIARSSGGVSGIYSTNGNTNKQYRITFPQDISQCSYQVTSGDTTPVDASGSAFAYLPAVTRSNIDVNTVAVTLWNSAGGGAYGNQVQDSFHIAVFC